MKLLLATTAALLLALATPAAAQIAHEGPGRVKAANRRALREARHTKAPYKETHLQVTRAQLKRGQSDQPLPAGREELRFRDGVAQPAKEAGQRSRNHKKKP